jgi:hypothetical protein
MTLPTVSEYVNLFLDGAQRRLGVAIDRTEGSAWDKIAHGFASALRRSDLVAVRTVSKAFLDGCQGVDLDDYCAKRGPVRRLKASKARARFSILRDVLTGGAGTIYEGTEIRVPYKSKSYVYVVKSSVNVAASSYGVLVDVEAVTAGSEYNVGSVASGVAKFTGEPSPIFDSNLTVSVGVVAGGSNDEKDEQLRYRQRLYEQARERATEAAIAYGAMSVGGVKHVVPVVYSDPNLGSKGLVYIADELWNSNDVMAEEVTSALESWRAFGPSLPVRLISTTSLSVSATVKMSRRLSAYNQASLRLLFERQVAKFFAEKPDPYSYDLNLLAGFVARAHDEVSRVVIHSPVSDVASPLTPAAIEYSGLPTVLTRYNAPQENVTIQLEGT